MNDAAEASSAPPEFGWGHGVRGADEPPPPPNAARDVFGRNLPLVERYGALLVGPAVERGLLGPGERQRLWERHILNCAVVAELIPTGARVVDIGSGAGLPGIVLAIGRPDLTVTLLEPMLRRTTFLEECVEALDFGPRVGVRRGRAEDVAHEVDADVATARAVASLDRLVRWALPLLKPGGQLLAMKGEKAEDELARAGSVLDRWAVREAAVVRVGEGAVEPPTTIVRVVAGAARGRRRGRKR